MNVFLEKLRTICYRNEELFYYKFFARKISIYLSWILIKLNISANNVTIMGILFLLNGIYLFSLSTYLHSIMGAIFLQFWLIFDAIDGEVARYNNYTNTRSESSKRLGEWVCMDTVRDMNYLNHLWSSGQAFWAHPPKVI